MEEEWRRNEGGILIFPKQGILPNCTYIHEGTEEEQRRNEDGILIFSKTRHIIYLYIYPWELFT